MAALALMVRLRFKGSLIRGVGEDPRAGELSLGVADERGELVKEGEEVEAAEGAVTESGSALASLARVLSLVATSAAPFPDRRGV